MKKIIKEGPKLIMEEYQNKNILLKKAMFQIGQKRCL